VGSQDPDSLPYFGPNFENPRSSFEHFFRIWADHLGATLNGSTDTTARRERRFVQAPSPRTDRLLGGLMAFLPFCMALVALGLIFVGLIILCPAAALVASGLLVARVAWVMDQGQGGKQ
jgi:hypothetical protein